MAPLAPAQTRAAAPVMETIDDLKAMSTKLNPVVGYWVSDSQKPHHRETDEWGLVAATLSPGQEESLETYPTHTFVFVRSDAHEGAVEPRDEKRDFRRAVASTHAPTRKKRVALFSREENPSRLDDFPLSAASRASSSSRTRSACATSSSARSRSHHARRRSPTHT